VVWLRATRDPTFQPATHNEEHTMYRFKNHTSLLCLLTFLIVLAAAPARAAAATKTYIVLYKSQAVPPGAATAIAKAGGTFVYGYDAIGVAIARSGSANFRDNLLKNSYVEGVAATTNFGVRLGTQTAAVDSAEGPPPGDLPNALASDSDNLSGLQWDMRQIHTPEAHIITGGSPAVLVGDIDTGLDYTHPDLAPNVDFANSVSCVGGAPDQNPAAWNDDNGHGTHTAGTIAAAANGIGIVGVAPNVKIAAIKAGNANGFFFPEAVICSFSARLPRLAQG
jgi:lantibiotic leader peptide-processing serine protease